MNLTAARRIARPARLEPCMACGEKVVGRNYGRCQTCTEAVDRFWRADWQAVLVSEAIAPGSEDERLLARIVVEECDRHPWTAVDHAMTLLRCGSCGAELGGGPPGCAECEWAFGQAMFAEQAAAQAGLVTINEHALHIGRWVVRHPHRYTEQVRLGWRWHLPIMLTGAIPPSTRVAARIRHLLAQGKEAEALALWEEEHLNRGGRAFR